MRYFFENSECFKTRIQSKLGVKGGLNQSGQDAKGFSFFKILIPRKVWK